MSLRSEQERINTATKLARLIQRREALRAETGGDKQLRELSMESLRRTIHELQDEIAHYDAQSAMPASANSTRRSSG
jgi:hypothetical protein